MLLYSLGSLTLEVTITITDYCKTNFFSQTKRLILQRDSFLVRHSGLIRISTTSRGPGRVYRPASCLSKAQSTWVAYVCCGAGGVKGFFGWWGWWVYCVMAPGLRRQLSPVILYHDGGGHFAFLSLLLWWGPLWNLYIWYRPLWDLAIEFRQYGEIGGLPRGRGSTMSVVFDSLGPRQHNMASSVSVQVRGYLGVSGVSHFRPL